MSPSQQSLKTLPQHLALSGVSLCHFNQLCVKLLLRERLTVAASSTTATTASTPAAKCWGWKPNYTSDVQKVKFRPLLMPP